jgi:hypothetical protein
MTTLRFFPEDKTKLLAEKTFVIRTSPGTGEKMLLCSNGFEFIERMSMVDPIDLIDIDETASSPAVFFKKYGYA